MTFVESVIEEAARLFGVRAAHLFDGQARYHDAWVKEAEAAISYTFWLTQQHAILAEHVGRNIQFGPLVTTCIRRRNRDQKYSDLVGELVWFAQRTAMSGAAA